MNKTLMEFIKDNFEGLDGTTDDLGNLIDVWNVEGDRLLFTLEKLDEDETYFMILWHEDNRSAMAERVYLSPTEAELIVAVQSRLDEVKL